jgi:hypothetical protein
VDIGKFRSQFHLLFRYGHTIEFAAHSEQVVVAAAGGFESSSGSQISRPRNWPTRWFTEAQVPDRTWASSVSPTPSTTYAVPLILTPQAAAVLGGPELAVPRNLPGARPRPVRACQLRCREFG